MQQSTDDPDVDERALKKRRVDEAEEEQEGNILCPGHIARDAAGQHGYRYGDISIDGHAQVQIGDISHYQNGPRPQPDKYEILLASLTFDRMDARLRNVAAAVPTTCEWLIHHEQFVAWTDIGKIRQHNDFLWIKGKPGSGKSTIMKETLAWAQREWPSRVILSYFFNARSPNQLEKSSLGLYRSLLHQLLCAVPGCRALFKKKFASKVRDDKVEDKVEDWTETELQNFMIELITTIQLPLLNIFIDALDEGSDDDVRQMVKFLERLTRYTTTTARRLRICLSSRHYPYMNIDNSLSLILENQVGHSQDIKTYIRNELAGGDSPQMNNLRYEIHERSAGVFLWIVLVVPMINKAYDQGKSSTAMLRKLKEIPPGLNDIVAQIFSKGSEDLDEFITLLKWVLFSMQPLSPIQLYHSIQYTCLDADMDDDIALKAEAVARYLLNCSRGLIELTKAEPFIVQFIHETIRGYLLNTNVLKQRQSSTRGSNSLVPAFQADRCHIGIAEECLRYLLNVCEKAPSTEEILEKHPLALYTAEFWWQHLQLSYNSCSQRLLEIALRLLTGDRTNLLTWVQLHDIDKAYSEPDLSLVVKDLAPPLYYAALIGITELVSLILIRGADVNAQGGRYVSALQAASFRGYEKMVQILVDAGANVNAQGGVYGNALQAASLRGHEKMVQILVDAGADVNAQGGVYGNALYVASACGHEKVVQILVDAGADINTQGGEYGNALQVTSTGRHEKVVQILLKRGAKDV